MPRKDVDFLTEVITVQRSKHGHSRRMPMNSTVRSVLRDLGSQRQRPNDPAELVFPCRHTQAGADLLIIKEVGGWKTLAMVQRYAHLTPNRLHEAVERLVSNGATELARNEPAVSRRVAGVS